MLKKIAFMFCLATKLIALSCSNPITVSSTGEDAYSPTLKMNDKGESALFWYQPKGRGEALRVTTKLTGEAWSPARDLVKIRSDEVFLDEALVDSTGQAYAIWSVPIDDENELVQYAQQALGQFGKEGQVINSLGSDMQFSHRAIDSEGNHAHIAMTYKFPNMKIVVASVARGQKPVYTDLISSGDVLLFPRIFYGKSGTAVALWERMFYDRQQSKTVTILEYAMQKRGGTWSAPVKLCQAPDDIAIIASTTVAAIDTKDNMTLVWIAGKSLSAGTNRLKIQAISRVDGVTSPVTDLSNPEKDSVDPEIATDEQGNILAVWESQYGKKTVICGSYKPSNGSWSAPVEISSLKVKSAFPSAISDRAGNFIVTWGRVKKEMGVAVHGAVFSTAKQKWSSPVLLSPVGQECYSPSIAFTADGKGIITWTAEPKNGNRFIQVADLIVD